MKMKMKIKEWRMEIRGKNAHSNCFNNAIITHMHIACWNYLIHVKCGSMRGHMLGGS